MPNICFICYALTDQVDFLNLTWHCNFGLLSMIQGSWWCDGQADVEFLCSCYITTTNSNLDWVLGRRQRGLSGLGELSFIAFSFRLFCLYSACSYYISHNETILDQSQKNLRLFLHGSICSPCLYVFRSAAEFSFNWVKLLIIRGLVHMKYCLRMEPFIAEVNQRNLFNKSCTTVNWFQIVSNWILET